MRTMNAKKDNQRTCTM